MSQLQLNSLSSGVEITARDIDLLRGLFECRVMTVEHMATLYFAGRIEAARKRIWKLKTAGLVRQRPRRAYDPSVLFLAAPALRFLMEEGHIADYPQLNFGLFEKRACVSDLTVRHELDVLDVRAAFTQAVQRIPNFSLCEFSTWPRLYEFSAAPRPGLNVLVRPDGYIRLCDGQGEHRFFLEVDRSTEVQEVIARRAACYLNFYRQGGFAVRHGYRPEDYRRLPFRVLMVFRNAERRNNAAIRLLQSRPPIYTHTILTTMEEARIDPLGAIWVQPIDYRDAVHGTPFQVRPASNPLYRRQVDRDQFVAANLSKRALLQSPSATMRADW